MDTQCADETSQYCIQSAAGATDLYTQPAEHTFNLNVKAVQDTSQPHAQSVVDACQCLPSTIFDSAQDNSQQASQPVQETSQLITQLVGDTCIPSTVLDILNGTVTDEKGEELILGCNICNSSYKTAPGLRSHMEKHKSFIEESRLWQCNVCGKMFLTSLALSTHLQDHKSFIEEIQRSQCNICHKMCSSSHDLCLHMELHTREYPFICHICLYVFSSHKTLERHLDLHRYLKVNPLKCEECHKTFKNKDIYRHHERAHRAMSKYLCELCGFESTSPYWSKLHRHHHEKEKPLVCTLCGRSFIYKCNLARHLNSHINVT